MEHPDPRIGKIFRPLTIYFLKAVFLVLDFEVDLLLVRFTSLSFLDFSLTFLYSAISSSDMLS